MKPSICFSFLKLLIQCALASSLMMSLGCGSIPFFSKSPTRQFQDFVDDYFKGKFHAEREQLSIPFWWLKSESDSLQAVDAGRAMHVFHTIDTTALSVDDRIDWLQIEASLKREIRDSGSHDAEKIPIRYLTLGDLSWRIEGDRQPSANEWSEMLKAIRDAPSAMDIGRKQLVHPPQLWMRLAVNTAKRYEEFLSGTFVDKINSSAPESLKLKLVGASRETAIKLSAFRLFLSDTLVPGPDGSWAIGKEYYDWLLREYNFLPYTSDEMIQVGWMIHNETKTALQSIAHRIDSTKTWRQLIEEMKSRHPEAGKITDAYHQESDRVRALLVTKNLVEIPKPETLLFVPTPLSLRETYAWGGYGGIEDRHDTAEGRFFVTDVVPEMTPEQVQQKLRIQNNGWTTVIALHEGYPGHHLQTLYAMKNPRTVRSRLGSTYYGEGWALYAESWMAREGFYQNADDSLAWLNMRLWRTARVIIDPSIHTGKMTYDEAVQFMIDEVGLERSAAEAEVNRYTTWPTQAPSYIIGWLEIEKLKSEVQRKLGARFSEKEFVETLLGVGSLPLDLMKRSVLEKFFPSTQ